MKESDASVHDGMAWHCILMFENSRKKGEDRMLKALEAMSLCGLHTWNTGSAINYNNLLLKTTRVILDKFVKVLRTC